MSKNYEILINSEFTESFGSREEAEATKFYYAAVKNNKDKLVKLVMHRRKEVLVSKPSK